MEDFNAVAAEIGRQLEERHRALSVAFDQEQRRIQGLKELLKRIGTCNDAFDEEDKAAVLAEIAARETALQQLQRESRRQEEVRRQKEAILFNLHTVLTDMLKQRMRELSDTMPKP